ncbi:MAG: hypothetical protein P9X22_04855 [Candidatus Zapsychrus exili]|nr:hypothetical protein [Candidatus Zapsychrus exili]
MRINIRKIFILFLILFSVLAADVSAKDKGPVCAVYLSGIGCHNCAVADPILFTEFTAKYPDLIIFEYEIYKAREENKEVKDKYFKTYFPGRGAGVPFITFSKKVFAVGATRVIGTDKIIELMDKNDFPLPNGKSISFDELDIAALDGKINIWTKNRVLLSGEGGDNKALKQVLTELDIADALEGIDFKVATPMPVPISGSSINFGHAVKIGGWRLQWNGGAPQIVKNKTSFMQGAMFWIIVSLILFGFAFTLFRVEKTSKGARLAFDLKKRLRDVIIVSITFVALTIFFIAAKNISPDFLENAGYKIPLPIFTFLIALVDGFNPCNMFVLTCLLAILIATTSSRKRLFAVALSFVATVYVFYFLFMAAWLNVFNYISFIKPLRITIGLIAIAAGIINCKDLFFFKKGISLTIPDSQKGPLMRKIGAMKEVIQNGSMPLLISSSIALASLASLVELPCTAGFPIIYTGILSGKGLDNTLGYYGYLALYNFVYVMPLLVIISVLIYTFRARQITQRHMEIIKFIGGAIMLLLGIVLLVNPALIGLSIG